ncbi:MAG: glycosyltransferase [Elusimicrobiota bacterium]
MDKIKIFHLITSLNIGGTEKNLLTVLKNLNHKYDFFVGYLKEKGQVAYEIEKFGIPVEKFSFFSLISHLKKNKYKIIHTHLYRANILGRLAGKIAGIPAVISIQQSIDRWRKFYHIWLDKYTTRFCDLIIANSRAAKNVLIEEEKVSAEKIVVIYNGTSFNSEVVANRKSINEFVVGCVMRLHIEKGVYLIPEIAKIVKNYDTSNFSDKGKDIKFSIFGDGPERDNLKLQITNYKLQNEVRLFGWQNDLEKIYNSVYILLLPSIEESFPQAVLDAMAFGIPVVATDVGGLSELVENNKTGILIKNRTPEAFASAILSIIKDQRLYQYFSENSRTKAAEFTIKKMVNLTDDIYQNLSK